MGVAVPEGEARAAEALERATTVPELLRASCVALVELLDASACAISRVLGDVLVALTEYAPAGESLQLGQGFLVTDFPLTQEVIRRGESRAASLLDDDPDPQEAALLEELGFDSLLMVPMLVERPVLGARRDLRTRAGDVPSGARGARRGTRRPRRARWSSSCCSRRYVTVKLPNMKLSCGGSSTCTCPSSGSP